MVAGAGASGGMRGVGMYGREAMLVLIDCCNCVCNRRSTLFTAAKVALTCGKNEEEFEEGCSGLTSEVAVGDNATSDGVSEGSNELV